MDLVSASGLYRTMNIRESPDFLSFQGSLQPETKSTLLDQDWLDPVLMKSTLMIMDTPRPNPGMKQSKMVGAPEVKLELGGGRVIIELQAHE